MATHHKPAAKPARPPPPLEALDRLSHLHAETSQTARTARFVGSAVGAAAALMAWGAAALALAGGAGLQSQFLWSVLVLLGVGAMLRCYIKSIAQGFDRAPLMRSARALRAVLIYAGFAWGAGAFLVLGDNPVPLLGLAFAVLPGATLGLIVSERRAVLGFMAPVTALTAAAAMTRPWSGAAQTLAVLLIVQSSIAVLLAWHSESPA